jgi:glutamate transport system permease protein
LFIGAIYIVLCLALSWVASYLERRNRRVRVTAGPAPAVPMDVGN